MMSTKLSPKYSPFIRLSEQDVPPETPCLALKMEAHCDMSSSGAKLCLTLPYHLIMTITHLPNTAFPDTRPIVFRWSPFDTLARGRFVLLHEKLPEQLEPVDIGVMEGLVEEFYHEKDTVEIRDTEVIQLSARPPGNRVRRGECLTDNYQTKLIPGERYHLIWPGAMIDVWDWGSKGDHTGQVLRKKTERPPLIMLPAAGIVFKAVETDMPCPDRAKDFNLQLSGLPSGWANHMEELWRETERERLAGSPEPISPEQRVQGAPVLNFEFVRAGRCEAPRAGDTAETITKVTYLQRSNDDRPITFHTTRFYRPGQQLYLWREGKWKEFGKDWNKREPRRPQADFKVGERSDFVSLRPGESWTSEIHFHMPPDMNPGDRLKFVFKGATLDWWDWGNKEDHSETVVSLPRRGGGSVTKPRDNDGRPTLIVPGSDDMEVTWELPVDDTS